MTEENELNQEPAENQTREANPPAATPVAESSVSKPAGAEMPRFQMAALSLAGTGLALALLLGQLHYQTHVTPNAEQFCSVGTRFDCAAVAASPLAIFAGLPWAVWGVLGFLALGIAAFQRSKWLLPLSAAAAFTSVALFGLSAFLIGSLCFLCEGVHAVSIALFVVVYRHRRQLLGRFNDWSSAGGILGVPVALALVALVALPRYWSAFSYKADPPFDTGRTSEGHYWIGSDDPEVTIHEFVNYRCPYCALGSARMLRALAKNSDWRVVRHPQPMMSCSPDIEISCDDARMAYCAGEQGKFWRADRWLFANAKPESRFDRSQLIAALALDRAAFESCFTSREAYEYNDRSYRYTREIGMTGVPAYEVQAKGEIPAELKPLITKLHKPKPRKVRQRPAPKRSWTSPPKLAPKTAPAPAEPPKTE